jgi:hypothetical protein
MERIDIENARIRVEFLKNETNEVVKSEWFDVVSYFCSSDFEHEMEDLLKDTGADYYKIVEFEDIPQELQLSDRLPDETIALCNYFCTREDDENFKEAFFYWVDNYHYKLLGADIKSLINKAIDAYVGYYDDAREFVDFDLYERDLMYDYFNVNGHIFKQ